MANDGKGTYTIAIRSIRWHLDRYDRLRASTASRAAVVLSANAVVLAGLAILAPQFLSRQAPSGIVSSWAVGLMTIVTLVLILASITDAIEALLSRKSWRQLFGDDAPSATLYIHTDTLKAATSYAEFSAVIHGMTDEQEFEFAAAGLWAGINAHNHRYQKLRRASSRLYWGTISLGLTACMGIIITIVTMAPQ